MKSDIVSACLLLLGMASCVRALIPLPSFTKMKEHYPGYKHAGGRYHNNHLIDMIGCKRKLLLHDTSALRLSYSFNKVGGEHSLGHDLIHLSRNGIDSVVGTDGLQYIYHPIAYGPFLADKYGYPTISKLHQFDPVSTKKNFWGKQGILRVITYRKIKNLPVGHVALWDCDHFHETKDWISGHSLITVEFWESPDSNCSSSTTRYLHQIPVKHMKQAPTPPSTSVNHQIPANRLLGQSNHPFPVTSEHSSLKNNPPFNQGNQALAPNSQIDLKTLMKDKTFRRKFIKKYYVSNGHLRHAKHRGLSLSKEQLS
ncbi:uncharacterized protein LOC143072204 [Mytilus galloprovincialis]|uniref:uncharacterized protein LOC143072204 n=1 Tax=Mytilus galloprovincialis TaxID=29158 RepID=UPI003F7C245D